VALAAAAVFNSLKVVKMRQIRSDFSSYKTEIHAIKRSYLASKVDMSRFNLQ